MCVPTQAEKVNIYRLVTQMEDKVQSGGSTPGREVWESVRKSLTLECQNLTAAALSSEQGDYRQKD